MIDGQILGRQITAAIQRYMADNKLSQKQVANEIGMNENVLGRYARGHGARVLSEKMKKAFLPIITRCKIYPLPKTTAIEVINGQRFERITSWDGERKMEYFINGDQVERFKFQIEKGMQWLQLEKQAKESLQ